jgi:hypothetical protein
LGVPLRVGLSAISFSAALQKDAAPIPNAKSNQKLKLLAFEPLVLEKSSKALVLSSKKELPFIQSSSYILAFSH